MTEREDDIELLVRRAGARQQPSAELVQSAMQESFEAWQDAVAQQRINRWQQFGLSIAAGVVLTASFLFYENTSNTFGVNLIMASHFQVDDREQSTGALRLSPNSHILAIDPARIITGTGIELRLGTATSINWMAPDKVYLESGTIYVDTHNKGAFDVDTSLGLIHDIGTRYLIVADTNGVELAVREGEAVVVSNGKSTHLRGDGINAQVAHLNNGDLVIRNELASHNRWEWIHKLTPDYPDVSVQKLLEAICADLGKQLIYESPGVETSTINQRVASGSLRGLHPADALKVLVEISGLQMSENSTEIRITF